LRVSFGKTTLSEINESTVKFLEELRNA